MILCLSERSERYLLPNRFVFLYMIIKINTIQNQDIELTNEVNNKELIEDNANWYEVVSKKRFY